MIGIAQPDLPNGGPEDRRMKGPACMLNSSLRECDQFVKSRLQECSPFAMNRYCLVVEGSRYRR